MVREKLETAGDSISKVCGGSYAFLKRMAETIIETFEVQRDRIPVYEIQHDGTIKRFWENPDDTTNRAYDLEHNHRNQIFLKGYSNALDVDIESIETGDVKLKPSKEYKIYMRQKVLSDSMMAGSDVMNQVKYLTIANLILIVLAVIIGVSMAT